MMKRWLVLLFCAVFCSVWAQQPSEGRVPRMRSEDGRPRKNGSAEKVDGSAHLSEAVSEEPVAISSSNQENFKQIMGSFSDLAMKFSEKDSSDMGIFVYECKYISGKAFSQAMEPFLTVNGELSDCVDSDLVIISDEKDRIEKLKEIAAVIDCPVRQVLVSASVVEFQVTDGFEKDISLQYNQFENMNDSSLAPLPGGSAVASKSASGFASRIMDAIAPSGANPATLTGRSSYMYYDPDEQALFSAFLTFLETQGTAKILSSPSLILRRGHSGNILSGEDIPITKSNVGSGGTSYSVEYKPVGIKLRVTPQSIFDERVVLEVSPEVSTVIRYEESAAGRNPVVAIRNANTLLEMNDGYMVSIGGLLREEDIQVEKRVPILGNIPLLGTLFRSSTSEKVRSQLVIFMSVKIVKPVDLSADTIGVTGASDEVKEKINEVQEAIPQTKSTFWGGVKKLFH